MLYIANNGNKKVLVCWKSNIVFEVPVTAILLLQKGSQKATFLYKLGPRNINIACNVPGTPISRLGYKEQQYCCHIRKYPVYWDQSSSFTPIQYKKLFPRQDSWFYWLSPLGRVSLVVAMSVTVCVECCPLHMQFF